MNRSISLATFLPSASTLLLLAALLALTSSPDAHAQQRQRAPEAQDDRPAERAERYRLDPATGHLVLTDEDLAEIEPFARARREARLAELARQPRRPRTTGNRTPSASRQHQRGGATVLVVDAAYDEPDAEPGDGVCDIGLFADPQCTLRAAIMEANALPEAEPVFIAFDFIAGPLGPGPDGTWTILVNYDDGYGAFGYLPYITHQNVTIDGITQEGASCGALTMGSQHELKVILDGSLLPSAAGGHGLVALAGPFKVFGLVVQNFAYGYGIFASSIAGFGDMLIECNYLGTDYTGTDEQPNLDDILVGIGPVSVVNNLVSANNLRIENADGGFRCYTGDGVYVLGDDAFVWINLIGTDASGLEPLGLCSSLEVGVFVAGDDALIDENVISDNFIGIALDSFSPATVAERAIITNNTVGLSRLRTNLDLGNAIGISVLDGASDNDIGLPGFGNYVAGSVDHGISVGDPVYFGLGNDLPDGNNDNRIRSNTIGLDGSGNAAGNGDHGITVSTPGGTVIVEGTVIGGPEENAGNVIAGNIGSAISLPGGTGTLVEGNTIGLNAAGAARANTWGISTGVSTDLVVRDNTISGNTYAGVYLGGPAQPSTGIRIEGNRIGTTPDGLAARGNGDHGIECFSAEDDVVIGGLEPGQANVIAFNEGDGVLLAVSHDFTFCRGVSILANAIHDNDDLGINLCPSLGCDDVTPNDFGDGDLGANDLTNYPVITEALNDGTDASVAFTFEALPDTTYRIELFRSPAPDPSGHGEGQVFLTALDVVTDENGRASATVTLPPADLPLGAFVSATATPVSGSTPSGFGGTSEFSGAVEVLNMAMAPLTVTVEPEDPPVVVARGEDFFFDVTFTLAQNGPEQFEYWTEAILPNQQTRGPLLGPGTVLMTPGTQVTVTFQQHVPRGAPLGDYGYTLYAGSYPGNPMTSDGFDLTIVNAATTGRESDAWTVYDADGLVVEAGSILDLRAASSAPTAPEASSEAEVPERVALHAAAPNPFAGRTALAYDLPATAHVRLAVYDVLGRRVAVLVDGEQEAGRHTAVLDASALPSGTYLVRLSASGAVSTQRVTRAR